MAFSFLQEKIRDKGRVFSKVLLMTKLGKILRLVVFGVALAFYKKQCTQVYVGRQSVHAARVVYAMTSVAK